MYEISQGSYYLKTPCLTNTNQLGMFTKSSETSQGIFLSLEKLGNLEKEIGSRQEISKGTEISVKCIILTVTNCQKKASPFIENLEFVLKLGLENLEKSEHLDV